MDAFSVGKHSIRILCGGTDPIRSFLALIVNIVPPDIIQVPSGPDRVGGKFREIQGNSGKFRKFKEIQEIQGNSGNSGKLNFLNFPEFP